jgi:hypothetical protein
MIFSIDNDNVITALDAAPAEAEGLILFATEKDLTKATAAWSVSRLTEAWNSFAGAPPFGDLKPVKKFESRGIATARIWKAIQKLVQPPTAAAAAAIQAPVEIAALKKKDAKKATKPATKPATAPKVAKAATPAGTTDAPKAPREGTAKAKVIGMISKKGGATLAEIMEATSWKKHTIRGFMSTLPKKTGIEIKSTRREDGARVYEAVK